MTPPISDDRTNPRIPRRLRRRQIFHRVSMRPIACQRDWPLPHGADEEDSGQQATT